MIIFRKRTTSPPDSASPWAVLSGGLDDRRKAAVRRSRWTSEATALVLAVVFSAIYLSTRTAYYSVDAVRIAGDILASRTHGAGLLFHPGYLLFGPLGAMAWRIAEAFHYAGGPLPVLASINCVAGGIGIGLISLQLRAILTRSRALTVLVPIALGFSFGYWVIATDGRAEMPSVACSILASYLLVRAMLLPTPQRAAVVGLAVALAILMHVFAALMLVAGVVALSLADYTQGSQYEENRARATNIGLFLMAGIAPVVAAYVIVGTLAVNLHSASQWHAWLSVGASRDWWLSLHPLGNIRLDAYAFRRALFAEPGGKTGTFHLSGAGGALHTALYWSALSLWFIAVYAILSATAILVRTHYGAFLIVALATGALYAAVFTLVDPGYFVYWVPVTVASSVIMAICCSYYRGRRGGSLWLVGIGIWIVIFAASNFVQFIVPHEYPSMNPWMAQTKFIESRTRPGDVYVVSGFGDDTAIAAYLPYFGHRTVLCIRDSLERHNGNVGETARDMKQTLDNTLAAGHRAYASPGIWDDGNIRERLRDDYGVRDADQILGDVQRAPAWRDPQHPDETDWKLLPAADQSAQDSQPAEP